jgi:hypothetical protein
VDWESRRHARTRVFGATHAAAGRAIHSDVTRSATVGGGSGGSGGARRVRTRRCATMAHVGRARSRPTRGRSTCRETAHVGRALGKASPGFPSSDIATA